MIILITNWFKHWRQQFNIQTIQCNGKLSVNMTVFIKVSLKSQHQNSFTSNPKSLHCFSFYKSDLNHMLIKPVGGYLYEKMEEHQCLQYVHPSHKMSSNPGTLKPTCPPCTWSLFFKRVISPVMTIPTAFQTTWINHKTPSVWNMSITSQSINLLHVVSCNF